MRIADQRLAGRARVVAEPAEDTLARRLLFEKYSSRYGGTSTPGARTRCPWRWTLVVPEVLARAADRPAGALRGGELAARVADADRRDHAPSTTSAPDTPMPTRNAVTDASSNVSRSARRSRAARRRPRSS